MWNYIILPKDGQTGANKKPPSKPNKHPADKLVKNKAGQKIERGDFKTGQKSERADSIPDDTSYIACLKERQKESEVSYLTK